MKKLLSLLLLTIVALVLAACGGDKKEKEHNSKDTDSALSIYTTVYPLQYFAERIGGDHVKVSSIYPPGANEHTFEPTQKDMMTLADADLFFYIGLGLEGFVEKAKTTLAHEHVKLVSTADNVSEEMLHISTGHVHAEEEEGHAHEDEHEDEHNHEEEHGLDSHVWLSPVISKELAAVIKSELIKAMPEYESDFTKNYDTLTAELDQLHADFESMAAGTSKKTFFVSHAAFGYIAGHYGFTQVPVAGLNSQSEPSQKELMKIVDLAKAENIQYIFFEQNVSSSLTEVIQKEVGAKAMTLHNLSVLTPQDIANGETYFTLMRKNMEALKTALQ
ncbi:metal ABC transporter solute-binding protein, Zn/Mn family [Lysinibacillus odysseyi]|uniref:Adhesin n=1 Tax=Lysinibacillus odysseyi 34hs-1 = NBRC 100172 TaxID=1220589 RepID=A0A0A3ISQ6_9BACI|nr:zinc ABC transporter substrate-binding protein [Lysinibacillus odysseyi]KGR87746.1 adhesin [Lysinibacillus odysseyi 34hs-1 = NBRC 100172]